MKGLLRYKSISVWMLIIFTMSFIVFHFASYSSLTTELEAEDRINNSYKYENKITIYLNDFNTNQYDKVSKWTIECLKKVDTKCNLKIVSVESEFSDEALISLSDIYIKSDELKYNLVSGRYPTEDEKLYNKCAVLGVGDKYVTYNKAGKTYATINDEQYEITGFISTKRSHYLDNKRMIFMHFDDRTIENIIYEKIMFGGVELCFESDEDDLSLCVSKFIDDINEASNGVLAAGEIAEDESGEFQSSYALPEESYSLSIFSYIFCIIATVYIIQIWLLKRKDEIKIKKILGISRKKIIYEILFNILVVMILGIIIGIICSSIITYVAVGYMHFNFEIIYRQYSLVLIYIVFTLIVASINPILFTMKKLNKGGALL